MTNQTYVFDGNLTAIEPLTVTIKGVLNGRLPRNGAIEDTAYWPATTIRGSLRHAAHRVALMFNQENAHPAFDLADHFMLAQGVDIVGDLMKPADGEIDGTRTLRENNPMISLFGLWGVASKATIGNAFPLTPNPTAMFGGGARTIMFERSPELLEVLNEAETARLQNILEEQSLAAVDIAELKAKQALLKKQARTAEDKAPLYAEIASLETEIQTRKDAKGEARESIRRPIDQYEAITAGTVMGHRMSLKNASELELGFFIATLLEFARSPRMGGHQAHGCGLVEGSWAVKTWLPKALSPTTVGNIQFDGDGFRLEGEMLENAYKQWCENTTSQFKKLPA